MKWPQFSNLRSLFNKPANTIHVRQVFEVGEDYPCGHDPDMPFDCLNPLQSSFRDNYRHNMHCVVEAGTGTGKTIVGYIASRYFLDEGKIVVMTAPTKDLVKQLHTKAVGVWGAGYVGLYTGSDKSVEGKYFIVTTPEGFLSAWRSGKEWVKAGLLIIDEAHNILDPSRGGNLDVAMTIHVQSGGKVLLMSGTFPNKRELAEMLDADLFLAKYRRTKINVREIHCPDDIDAQEVPKKPPKGIVPTMSGHIYNRESMRLKVLKDILSKHKEDKVISFVPTKAIGYCLGESLVTPFHCGDLEDKVRDTLVAQFNLGELNSILATNTLSQGVDTPADVVVVCGTRRSGFYLDKMEVDQMFGRAGRAKDEATVYILGDKIELFHAKKSMVSLVKSLPLPVETMTLTLLAQEPCSKKDLASMLNKTYAASFTTPEKIDSAVDTCLRFLNECHILHYTDNLYSLTKEGILLARYFISPSQYISYIKVARKLIKIDMDVPACQEILAKGSVLLSMIIPLSNNGDIPERLVKDFQMLWETIIMQKEVSYEEAQTASDVEPQKSVSSSEKGSPSNSESEQGPRHNQNMGVTKNAQKSARVKHYVLWRSAMPKFFGFQLKDGDRFLAMLNDMEYYKIHPQAPGKAWIEAVSMALKCNLSKIKDKGKKKAAAPPDETQVPAQQSLLK